MLRIVSHDSFEKSRYRTYERNQYMTHNQLFFLKIAEQNPFTVLGSLNGSSTTFDAEFKFSSPKGEREMIGLISHAVKS